MKEKQRPLEVSKRLYDAYCETHCRANDIAIDFHKEFNFISENKIIPIIKEGIRILRFQRNKYKQALEEIRGICKKVAFSDGCDNCDGIGFYDGCLDDDCGNYACFKILDKINEVLND